MHHRILLLGLLLSNSALAVDVVAHRGNGCGFHENSVSAIKAAWALGVDGVEIDLRISSDDVPFLFHDYDYKGLSIGKLRYTEVNRRLGSAAPTLDDVLQLPVAHGYYILDLKERGTEFALSVAKVAQQSGISANQLIFQSENLHDLETIAGQLSESKFFYLARLRRGSFFRKSPRPDAIVSLLGKYNIDGISLKGRSYVDAGFVESIKDAGYLVYVWTINNSGRASYYRKIGVDGLITDDALSITRAPDPGRLNSASCGESVEPPGNIAGRRNAFSYR